MVGKISYQVVFVASHPCCSCFVMCLGEKGISELDIFLCGVCGVINSGLRFSSCFSLN
jgi:hypothetical protein